MEKPKYKADILMVDGMMYKYPEVSDFQVEGDFLILKFEKRFIYFKLTELKIMDITEIGNNES